MIYCYYVGIGVGVSFIYLSFLDILNFMYFFIVYNKYIVVNI